MVEAENADGRGRDLKPTTSVLSPDDVPAAVHPASSKIA